MNEEKEKYILDNYGKVIAQVLADKMEVSIHQVYEVARKYNITRKHNKKVNIDSDMHQVLISGILGDGRLKKNGRHNYCYSECHALGEEEYLRWKKDMLKDLAKDSAVYGKNMNNDHGKAVEFTSLTTPTLIPYSRLTKMDCIVQLTELGLLLLILDDGWGREYKNSNGLVLSFDNTYPEEMVVLRDKYNEVFNINSNIIGKKKKAISFSHEYEHVFKRVAREYNMEDLDVIKKKMSPFQ